MKSFKGCTNMREPIKDGEVRPTENGLALVVGIWQDGDEIHIIKEKGFRSSVNIKEGSVRCHRNLYKHLSSLLKEQGKWKYIV